MTSAFRTYDYYLKTEKGTKNCRDLRAAEYLYSCRKHATIIRENRKTGEKETVATK